MKRKMLILVVAVALPTLLFSFQNCSQVGAGRVVDGQPPDGDLSVEVFPFALSSVPRPGPGPDPLPVPMIGDLDHDGQVLNSDYDLLFNYVYHRPTLSSVIAPTMFPFGKEDFLRRADTNGDGFVTCYDLFAIQDVIDRELSAEDLPVLYGDANRDQRIDEDDLAYLETLLSSDIRPSYPVALLNVSRIMGNKSQVDQVDFLVLKRLIEGFQVLNPEKDMLSAPLAIGDVNLDCRISVIDRGIIVRETLDMTQSNFLAPRFWGDVDFSSPIDKIVLNGIDVEQITRALQLFQELPLITTSGGSDRDLADSISSKGRVKGGTRK